MFISLNASSSSWSASSSFCPTDSSSSRWLNSSSKYWPSPGLIGWLIGVA